MHSQVSDYLTFFLVATAGPILAFFAVLWFPRTEEDRERSQKFTKAVTTCCGACE